MANLDHLDHDSEERLLTDLGREFKNKRKDKIIIQNKNNVKNMKAILRRFMKNEIGYCDECLCVTSKRKKEYK